VALVVAGTLTAGAVPAAAVDTVGLVDPTSGEWRLRNAAGGVARFFFGDPGDVPFVGDWDCDGVETPGLYRQSDGFAYLRNSNSQGGADVRFFFGNPDDVPLAGDFDGDGCDTLAIYRPAEGRVYVKNTLGTGVAELSYPFGNPGDKPFSGDFDGDGIDTVGLHRESTGLVYFRDSHTGGNADAELFFGDPGDRLVAGDWGVLDGVDTPAVFRPAITTFFFRHTNTQGNADDQFQWGRQPWLPVAGEFGSLQTVPTIALRTVATGLSSPVLAVSPPGDTRLFIVEKTGRIRILENGSLLASPFLDISGLVSKGNEQGLLGLVFHPDYAVNRRFFVNYTDGSGDTRIAEYVASADPNRADVASRREILFVDQPSSNHNGGMIGFGPEGYLWIGMGDGGGSGDPSENAQNPNALLGAMLRIDVDGASPYGIPPDNPYAGGGGRPEIWSNGLRNPWRFTHDGGNVYIGDVGQNAWEEINVVGAGVSGVNYGWNPTEGAHCFDPPSGCSVAGLTLPVLEYSHGDGCSVTGGFVYRGSAIPGLAGHYLYGDFCSGWIRSFVYNGGVIEATDWTNEVGTVGSLSSFGIDASGEIYVLSLSGTVSKIVPG
jgi:hypothetical protein